jgi:LCP family protein required for cell wall assembly
MAGDIGRQADTCDGATEVAPDPGAVDERPDVPVTLVVSAKSVERQLATSVIVPGIATLRRSRVLGIVLLLVGCGFPIVLVGWLFVNRDDLIGFALDQRLLTIVMVVGIVALIARVVAIGEVAWAFKGLPAISIKTSIAAVAVAAIAVPTLVVVEQANQTRITVGEVFSSGDDSPLFEPDAIEPFRPDPAASGESGVDAADSDDSVVGPVADDPDSTGTAADPDAAEPDVAGPEAAEPAAPIDPSAVRTTLLLGGDAGPGRWGMRTDTMILFSVHEASGRTALVSIPRNLTRLHFPPGTPLADEFPNGFDDLTNAVFTHVATNPKLVEAYGADGQRPEVVALAQGLGYSLDVKIDDFVLVNMQGFKDVIDAVGGVRVEVPKRVLLQIENPVGDYDPPDSLGPGMVDLDGTLAIAYVRARRGDSDYQRMERQRQVLAALGTQVSTADAMAAFPKVSDVLGDSMRTSLSSGEFSSLLDRLGDNASIGESVGLIPPLITPGRPDYANIQSIIDAVERYVLTGEPSGFAK